MSDITNSETYFRRAKNKGDIKLIARGLLHLVKHLGLTEGRDFGRANDLLDRAWKPGSKTGKLVAEAMWLVAKELKKKSKIRKRKSKGTPTDADIKSAAEASLKSFARRDRW